MKKTEIFYKTKKCLCGLANAQSSVGQQIFLSWVVFRRFFSVNPDYLVFMIIQITRVVSVAYRIDGLSIRVGILCLMARSRPWQKTMISCSTQWTFCSCWSVIHVITVTRQYVVFSVNETQYVSIRLSTSDQRCSAQVQALSRLIDIWSQSRISTRVMCTV